MGTANKHDTEISAWKFFIAQGMAEMRRLPDKNNHGKAVAHG